MSTWTSLNPSLTDQNDIEPFHSMVARYQNAVLTATPDSSLHQYVDYINFARQYPAYVPVLHGTIAIGLSLALCEKKIMTNYRDPEVQSAHHRVCARAWLHVSWAIERRAMEQNDYTLMYTGKYISTLNYNSLTHSPQATMSNIMPNYCRWWC